MRANAMNVLMDKVEDVASGTNRGLLIASDNQFLKKQVKLFIAAKNQTYRWFTGDVSVDAFFELIAGKHILVFDGLNYNKRGIDGLLYKSLTEQSSKVVFKEKEAEFTGKIILFGTNVIKNPKVRAYFTIWAE